MTENGFSPIPINTRNEITQIYLYPHGGDHRHLFGEHSRQLCRRRSQESEDCPDFQKEILKEIQVFEKQEEKIEEELQEKFKKEIEEKFKEREPTHHKAQDSRRGSERCSTERLAYPCRQFRPSRVDSVESQSGRPAREQREDFRRIENSFGRP